MEGALSVAPSPRGRLDLASQAGAAIAARRATARWIARNKGLLADAPFKERTIDRLIERMITVNYGDNLSIKCDREEVRFLGKPANMD